MKEESTKNSNWLAIIAGITGMVVAVWAATFSSKKTKQTLKEKQRAKKILEEKNIIKNNLVKKLDEDSKKLKEEAICYYMHDFYLGEELPLSLVENIKKNYKPIYSLPYIDFSSYHLVGQEIEILNEILQERLDAYTENQQRDIKQRYESMLQIQAKEEALKIYQDIKKKFA